MIFIKQTELHDKDKGVLGNCLSAVLAGLLHLDIEEVPSFPAENQTFHVNDWLRQYGLALVDISGFDSCVSRSGIKGCHHEISGSTDRYSNLRHSCIGVDGQVKHDPHPSNAGLLENETYGLLVALRPWRMVEMDREIDKLNYMVLQRDEELAKLKEAQQKEYSDAELTKIYNEANLITEGKRPPISTEKIFAAMRACLKK